MMRSRDREIRRVRRLSFDAAALGLALILSYVESLLPLPLFLPLKPGLPNLAVMYVFFHTGRIDAAILSLLRVLCVSLLFGSVSSFFFSLGGAAAAFLALMLLSPACLHIGRVGVSVGSAAAHVTGQIVAAILLYGAPGLIGFLPWLLIGSVPFGILTGLLLILIERRLAPLPVKGDGI